MKVLKAGSKKARQQKVIKSTESLKTARQQKLRVNKVLKVPRANMKTQERCLRIHAEISKNEIRNCSQFPSSFFVHVGSIRYFKLSNKRIMPRGHL